MRAAKKIIVVCALTALFGGVAAPVYGAVSIDDDDAVGSPLLGAEPSPSPSQPSEALAAEDYVYPGDAEAEALLVAAEDRRLVDIDLVASGTLAPELDTSQPFRVSGSAVSTLVLTARPGAYTLDELNEVAPQSVVSLGGGSYRLNENIAIMPGATFVVSGRGPVELQIASQPEGFASVISLGGSLIIQGTPESPARVRSWDTPRGATDTNTADGRAYVRAIGGQVSVSNAQVEDLGFWSGNTGGFALTGTDEAFGVAPGIDAVGSEDILGEEPQEEAEVAPSAEAGSADASASAEPVEDEGEATAAPLTMATGEAEIDPGTGESLIPLGVTAWLSDVTITGNAFGMFVSNAEQVEIHDSYVTESLVDGIVFHREVKRSNVVNTESSRNAGDGFRISRGSNGVLLDSAIADANGGNGITINAAPLATGPSAVGLSTEAYGDHIVRDSVVSSNAGTGIEVIGGADIELTRNDLTGSQFGIVIRDAAQDVVVKDNQIEAPAKQGIAVREGGTVEIVGNVITDTVTGVYSRDSTVSIVRNTISEVTNHGVTITGPSTGSIVEKNAVAGIGASAIDVFRAEGVEVPANNDITEWSTKSVQQQVVDSVTKPLTMLWIVLGALLVLTALLGIRRRRQEVRHPYRDRTPLSELTRGIIDPASVAGVAVLDAPPPSGARSEVPKKESSRELEPVGATAPGESRLANPGRARGDEPMRTSSGLPRRVTSADNKPVSV